MKAMSRENVKKSNKKDNFVKFLLICKKVGFSFCVL